MGVTANDSALEHSKTLEKTQFPDFSTLDNTLGIRPSQSMLTSAVAGQRSAATTSETSMISLCQVRQGIPVVLQRRRGRGDRRASRGQGNDLADIDYSLRTDEPIKPEILRALSVLKHSSAGSGFMHESFNANDARKFTRAWFAWANALFGELLATVAQRNPSLLSSSRSRLQNDAGWRFMKKIYS
jgi:hypothetical protein